MEYDAFSNITSQINSQMDADESAALGDTNPLRERIFKVLRKQHILQDAAVLNADGRQEHEYLLTKDQDDLIKPLLEVLARFGFFYQFVAGLKAAEEMAADAEDPNDPEVEAAYIDALADIWSHLIAATLHIGFTVDNGLNGLR